MAVCASCGSENPAGFRFCGSCGAPLDAEPQREERKVVTVLFADLVGFTARAERMDPEDVRAVLAPYWERLRGELEQRGGTVEKFIGDAVMALFGAPVAYEDDPERAVRAALAIRDWAREEEGVQVRIAVNTGEALVLLGARPVEGEGMAAGDVVNTAARLQSAAPVNGVLVGETTYRATRHVIDYAEREPVSAKGKAELIPVWEALQARSRLGVDLAAPATPLVGRTRELDLLVDAFERARNGPATQLVTLVGVPGIGKSRLVGELAEHIRSGEELVYWRQGRSLPYGEGVSFWSLAEMVKAQAGMLESDDEENARARIAEAVADLLGDDPDADWVEERLLALVGGGGETDLTADRRDDSFAAWRRFFEAMAERRPLVLVFEDLHWADDGLLDFVDHLVDWAGAVPLLVLGTARPELLERRPGWGGGKANALTLSLAPLSDVETARLVHGLLEQTLLPPETQAELLAHAGGNPLYAEQYARLLSERGSLDELPETVQGIIAARLDVLAAGEKALLQDAAVVGKVFWEGAAAAVGNRRPEDVRDLLHGLERKEFVVRARRTSVEGETEYAFRHVLVRDVAYGQIPRAARSGAHRAAGDWIASLGRPDDHAEMLAHHRVSAVELAEASGLLVDDLVPAAALALGAAGDRAARLQSRPAALGFYRRALELMPQSDPQRGLLLLRAGEAAVELETDVVELLEEASHVLQEQGDTASAAEAEAALGLYEWMQGGDCALARSRRAAALVEGEPDSRSKAYVLAQLGRMLALGEQRAEAVELLREATGIAERLAVVEIQLFALHYLGLARFKSGLPEGRAEIEESIELARTHDPTFVPRALNNLGYVLFERGDIREALDVYEESLRLAERLGLTAQVRWQHVVQMGMRSEMGDWDGALAILESDPSLLERGFYNAPAVRGMRAIISFARGADPVDEMRLAVEEAGRLSDAQASMPVHAGAIFVFAETGNEEDARRSFRSYVECARAMVRPHYGYFVLATLGTRRLGLVEELRAAFAHHAPGRWHDCLLALLDGKLAEAAVLVDEAGWTAMAAIIRLEAAEELIEAGRRAEADEQLAPALEFFRRERAARFLQRADALLAATA
jgi:class 3 adenylate cyclase/tetratricopeptide (TPR) repeat protein